MAKWQAAYWGEKGLDIYQMTGEGHPQLLYTGPLEGLKPIAGGIQRRILVLGSNNLIRLRKQYPPMKMEKLIRAVEMEAPTLFPLVNCAFHCRIAETYATHVILDIWAWERAPLELIRKSFAFRYVIPEDLTFLAAPPGVDIYSSGTSIRAVACGEGRFLDAASYPADNFSPADLERFITGLNEHVAVSGEIRCHGDMAAEVTPPLISRVKRISADDCPPFLAGMDGMALHSFRVQSVIPFPAFSHSIILRFAVYSVLAYAMMLFLTLRDYDQALMDLRNKSILIEKEISLLDRGGLLREDPELRKDYETKTNNAHLPLHVLDVLAEELPEESYVKSLVYNNGILDVTVSAHDILAVIKQLGNSDQIGKVSLKGSPVKAPATGLYDGALLLEINL